MRALNHSSSSQHPHWHSHACTWEEQRQKKQEDDGGGGFTGHKLQVQRDPVCVQCVRKKIRHSMFLLDYTLLSFLVPFLSWSPPDTLRSQKSLADTPDVVAHTCNPNTLEAEASVCQTTEGANLEPGVWLSSVSPALQGHPWPNSEVEASQGYRKSCPK